MKLQQDWDADALRRAEREPGMLQIITLVLWLSCLVIGLLAMLLQAAPVPAPVKITPITELPPQPVLIDVDLSEPPPAEDVPPAPQSQLTATADVPPMPVVAAPSPAIAFAAPVEGPVRVSSSGYWGIGRSVAMAQPTVRRLAYGRGEGKQPRPDYPREAVAAGEQGTVGVRLIVAADGSVARAWAVSPSPWPLLNEAALGAVLQEWHFPSGSRRIYDVFITFKLNQT